MTEINLLGKTEIRIDKVKLANANLNQIADTTSTVLGLDRTEVLVTDVREDNITIDILRKTLPAENVYGKQRELLNQLSKLPGVLVDKDSTVHSEGILGLIALQEEEAKRVVKESRKLGEETMGRMRWRVMVFPTGFELKKRSVEDTNTPMIAERFEKEGYKVTEGRPLDDDEALIANAISDAVDRGYGLVITTGGIGAELKDRTVEAIQRLDPKASTPYIAYYKVGTGRHAKDGVRIAVGKIGETTLVALPGPNDEVRACLEPLLLGLSRKISADSLANLIADELRGTLQKIHRH